MVLVFRNQTGLSRHIRGHGSAALAAGPKRNGEKDWATTRLNPHILIGVDPGLTKQVWQSCDSRGHRPFVLSVSLDRLRLGGRWPVSHRRDGLSSPLRDRHVANFDLEKIVGSLFCGRADFDDAVEAVTAVFNRVRRNFQRLGTLEGAAPLTTVVVGNHFSLVSALKVGNVTGNLNLEPFFLRLDRMRGRALACLLGAALERLDGVELRWLSKAVPEMTPKIHEPEYDAVVAQARASLRLTKPPALVDVKGIEFKLPTSPMIYVRVRDGAPWEPLSAVTKGRGGHSVTNELIKDFKKERRASNGRLQGVLIKVVGDEVLRHSPADTPIITATHRKMAKAAGLQAILLDTLYGVIPPPKPGEEKYCKAMPVFAA